MPSVVSLDVGRELRARSLPSSRPLDVALLGCGTVGTAFATLAALSHHRARAVEISTALVRDARRERAALGAALRTELPEQIFLGSPDVVVELLGGVEPARSLAVEALHRHIPVVTANKSLLAAHGPELRDAAAATLTPLLYEAAVIAGVPFLGTFARRPHAAQISSILGIANGTSNYVLTRACAASMSIDAALAAAQRLGLAEPDPSNDIEGIDAAEKLVVLLQHFADVHVSVGALERRGIREVTSAEIEHARALDGTIKPVIAADWSDALATFVGPAFVPHGHLLAAVDDAENALVLGGPRGRIVFRGPGAGPEVTAATVLDDVLEAGEGRVGTSRVSLRAATCSAPESEWLVSLAADRLPRPLDVADLLASHGVFIRRTTPKRSTDGVERIGALTWPAERSRIDHALAALRSASGCDARHFRALEV
jgi:homoserine dehydrogenase